MGRIETEHVNYVLRLGGDLPLFFSGGVMFYRGLPWKVEKPCYKQMHARNERALEKVNQTGTATLLFYMKIWCICKKKLPVWLANIGKMMQRI